MNGSGKIQQPTRYLPHLIVADVRERLVHVVYVIAFPSIGRTTSTTYRVSFGVAAGAAVHRSQIIVILCWCCWFADAFLLIFVLIFLAPAHSQLQTQLQ